jgi:hypothetical protein
MQLDCETPVGKQFIKDQHDVESLIERRYNVTVKTKTNKIEKYDADIYRNDSLVGVCEIKTRPFWNRKDKTPFTLDLLKRNGYLITAEKLDILQIKSLNEGVISCIFVKIPHENTVASIKVTDKKGNFLINFEKRFSKTKYSSNDYKGDTFRDNAFIKYDPITFKTFKY